ncbi:MAG: ATP-binding cassette domain-containing protein [Planctomycetota bacterium]
MGRSYGEVRALDGVTLEIRPGEILSVVGPSGSGKSTLLRLLAARAERRRGSVVVDSRDLGRLEPRRLAVERTGFVHQDHRLVPNLRVAQNVLLGRLGRQGLLASLRSVVLPRRHELVRVHEVLERVGIQDRLFERCDKLSGGQRQRVAIARALYQEPRALLCDEPVASLDPTRSRAVLELLRDIAVERGLTLVLSMHDIDLAREYCPRLVGLRQGRVAFDRATTDIDDDELDRLYRLEQGELIEDGAARG